MAFIMSTLFYAVYSGMLAILVAILVSIIPVEISKELLGALIGVFPVGVVISLFSGIVSGWRKGLYTATIGIPIGALTGALTSEIISGLTKPTTGLVIGLITGIIIGLLASIRGEEAYSRITVAPLLSWSWDEVRRSFKGEKKVQLALSMIGGIGVILVGTVVALDRGIFSGFGMGGVLLLADLLLLAVTSGIQGKSLSKQVLVTPNQGIQLSARTGLYFCLAFGSCALLGAWLIMSNVAGSAIGWVCGLLGGISYGIFGGWFGGWNACVRHLVLRMLLWCAGSLPSNYAHFLDYAAERILLHKIGGGYIFIHRLLLEYFATVGMETNCAQLDTKDATIYHYQGLIFAGLSKYEQAIMNYTRAIELDPKEVSVYRDRGLVYVRCEEYQQAIADYASALDLDPKNVWIYRQRGMAYHASKEYEKAIADFTEAIRLEPERAVLYGERGRTYRFNKEYEKAIVDFTRAVELAPLSAWSYSDRGSVYIQLKEYEKAVADFNRSIELQPSNASLYSSRGYAYLWLKQRELASTDFVQHGALTPNSVRAPWMVIYANLSKRRPGSEVVESLEKIRAIAPEAGVAELCRGVALGLQERYSDSIAELEQLIQSGKSVQDACFWKGLFCAYLGQDAEATKAIAQALEAGLPPILLTPLYWLEQEQLDMYQAVAVPFLVKYDIRGILF
jgi:tetratricopeptide (TPR) repeat protein